MEIESNRKLLLAEYLEETVKLKGEKLIDIIVQIVEDLEEMKVLKPWK